MGKLVVQTALRVAVRVIGKERCKAPDVGSAGGLRVRVRGPAGVACLPFGILCGARPGFRRRLKL